MAQSPSLRPIHFFAWEACGNNPIFDYLYFDMPGIRLLISFTVLLLQWTSSAGEPLLKIGAWARANYGFASAVEVKNDFLFVGTNSRGLLIMDISDLSAPKVVTLHPGPTNIEDLFLVNDTLFVAYSTALEILDVSNPAQPTSLSLTPVTGYVVSVHAQADHAAVWTRGSGGVLLDISDLRSPKRISTLPLLSTLQDAKIEIVDSTIYLGDTFAGTRKINLANPGPLRWETATLQYEGPYARHGTIFFIASSGRLVPQDFSRGISNNALGSLNSGVNSLSHVALNSNASTAVVLSMQGHIWFVDVTNPTAMQTLALLHLGSESPSDLIISGNRCYVAARESGVIIYDLENITSKPPVTLRTGEAAKDLVVDGNLLWVANGAHGVTTLDITNPRQPVAIQHFDTPSSATGIAVNDRLVCVADHRGGVRVLDYSNLQAPVELSNIPLPPFTHDVAIKDSHLFVAADADLLAFDLSNPSLRKPAGRLDYTGEVLQVNIIGNILYAAGSQLRAFDISNPPEWPLLWSRTNNVSASTFVSDTEIIIPRPDRLIGIDPQNPLTNAWEGRLQLGFLSPVRIDRLGNYLLIPDSQGSLKVIDLSLNTAPQIAQQIPILGWQNAVATQGSLAYVAAGPEGVLVFELSPSYPELKLTCTKLNQSLTLHIQATDNSPLTQEHLDNLELLQSPDLQSWTTLLVQPTLTNGAIQFPNLDLTQNPRYFKVRLN